jgi:hypothetical protein
MISIRQAIIDGDAGASLGDAATFLECLVRKFADESTVLNIAVAFFHFFSGFAATIFFGAAQYPTSNSEKKFASPVRRSEPPATIVSSI